MNKKLISVYNLIEQAIKAQTIDSIREKLSLALSELATIISPKRDIVTKVEKSRCVIITGAGDEVDIFKITKDNVHPYNTIDTLSRMHRFTSNSKLTVAEHCSNMAKFFLNKGMINEAKYALTHEIVEQFTGDLATPFKNILPEIRMLEDRVLKDYWSSIGLDPIIPELVHKVDKAVMFKEAKQYMPLERRWDEIRRDTDYPVCEVPIREYPLSIADAKYEMAMLWERLELPIDYKLENYITIETTVREHEKWIRGEGGKRADFTDKTIVDFDFSGRNLEQAILINAEFRNCNINGCRFKDANTIGFSIKDKNGLEVLPKNVEFNEEDRNELYRFKM